jgi:hypothetical protein
MGIEELWSKAVGDIKKKDAVPFSVLKGTIVGVNVSIWLHINCHTDTIALHSNWVPKCAPTGTSGEVSNQQSSKLHA